MQTKAEFLLAMQYAVTLARYGCKAGLLLHECMHVPHTDTDASRYVLHEHMMRDHMPRKQAMSVTANAYSVWPCWKASFSLASQATRPCV